MNAPNCIYEVAFKGCNLTNVGETSWAFGTRLEEYRREAKKGTVRNLIAQNEKFQKRRLLSLLSDYATMTITGSRANLLRSSFGGRPAGYIRVQRGRSVMNRDDGIYFNHVYYPVIQGKVRSNRSEKSH